MSYVDGLISFRDRVSTIKDFLRTHVSPQRFSPSGRPAIQSLLKEREESLLNVSRRLELALEASAVGVWEYHPKTGRLLWDSRMREIFERTDRPDELGYDDFRRAVHPEDIGAVENALASLLETKRKLLGDFRIVLERGRIRHLRAYGIVHLLDDGDKVVIGANWDITRDIELQEGLRAAEEHTRAQNMELETARKELEHQAKHDALTGLPNRRYLEGFISYIQARPLAEKTPVACLHIDLDRFKQVNDTMGHDVGDGVLQAVSKKLAELAKDACFLCRIGGDEFMMFVALPDAEEIANRIASNVVEQLSKPMEVDGRECRIGASVGVAIQPGGGDIARLIADADIALYEAKKKGRGRVRVFAPALRSDIVSNRQLADQILQGIEAGEFLPYFQLQFDAVSLEIAGAEALARWHHPKLGMVSPALFLPIAEEIGKLAILDEVILDKSLTIFQEWKSQGFVVPRISVNVSAQRLRDEMFLNKVTALDFEPDSLAFELLESISFDGQDASLSSAIDAIKGIGIDVEIDDFGTGHASIVSLLELSPNRLKIDRKLTRDVVTSLPQRKLVSSIVEIAKTLGIETIAEGVESMRQAEVLRDLGCDTLQGFALSMPTAGDGVPALIMPEYQIPRILKEDTGRRRSRSSRSGSKVAA